jgi:hypothetical protein
MTNSSDAGISSARWDLCGGPPARAVPTAIIIQGQLVLSPALHARGIYPPIDVLSRLMRHGSATAAPEPTTQGRWPGLLAECDDLLPVRGMDRARASRGRGDDFGMNEGWAEHRRDPF